MHGYRGAPIFIHGWKVIKHQTRQTLSNAYNSKKFLRPHAFSDSTDDFRAEYSFLGTSPSSLKALRFHQHNCSNILSLSVRTQVCYGGNFFRLCHVIFEERSFLFECVLLVRTWIKKISVFNTIFRSLAEMISDMQWSEDVYLVIKRATGMIVVEITSRLRVSVGKTAIKPLKVTYMEAI